MKKCEKCWPHGARECSGPPGVLHNILFDHGDMSDLIRDIEETKPANGDTLPFRVVKVPGKNQRRIIDAAGCVIATVYNYTPGREGGGKTMKAHARLFANAPYMLKALKSALPQLEESLKQGGPCDHDVGICACDLIRAITAVKESIGAAEGTV